jgi:hypothetical protein
LNRRTVEVHSTCEDYVTTRLELSVHEAAVHAFMVTLGLAEGRTTKSRSAFDVYERLPWYAVVIQNDASISQLPSEIVY